MHKQTELLYSTYAADSGASPGAGRILRACHRGHGAIRMDDLFRLDSGRREAALALLVTTARRGARGIPLAQDKLDRILGDDTLI